MCVVDRRKYRRTTDLYVEGREWVLKDGMVIWLQVMNPFELEEARHDAQVARGRVAMALKGPEGGDERDKVVAQFYVDGREFAIERLADAKAGMTLPKGVDSIHDDPEWKERLEILDRTESTSQQRVTEAEQQLLGRINQEYIDEVQDRVKQERTEFIAEFELHDEAHLLEAYIDQWLERRGGEVGQNEFNLSECTYAARACGGEFDGETWDHSKCEGHRLRIWESKDELLAEPGVFQEELFEQMRLLNMSVREAKNSDRQGSSSDSSPLPSAPEESTASTSEAVLEQAPGTSLQLSTTG